MAAVPRATTAQSTSDLAVDYTDLGWVVECAAATGKRRDYATDGPDDDHVDIRTAHRVLRHRHNEEILDRTTSH